MDFDARQARDVTGQSALRPFDYALLVLLGLILYGYSLLPNRVLTTHETVHCQNVREMFASHDWIIPSYGGRPWLERPPLPHWITGAAASLVGAIDQPWAMRLGSILMGLAGVLLTAWMAALWFGRAIGLLSGAILATTREFAHYAVGPEADIYLCAVVMAAAALVVQLEFRRRPAGEEETTRFFGRRPWPVLAFFVVLALTNLTKGPLFGTLFVLLPALGFFLWNADFRGLRRYVWFWGWLAFALVGLAWPLAAYLRYPDIVDLWLSDYGRRWNQGYIGEPFWYYLLHLPWNLFPWTVGAAVGLGLTARKVFAERSLPERFLWCWGLLPVVFLSLPEGKHHHYLLPCLAPWSVLAAVGTVKLWQGISQAPAWLRQPWLSLLVLGLPGDGVILLVRSRLPGPDGMLPLLLIGWPLTVAGVWWAYGRRDGRLAFGSLFALVVLLYCLLFTHRTAYLNSYRDDFAFLRQAQDLAPTDEPLFVKFDSHPLDASWFLFYLDGRAGLLHNLTFLRDERIQAPAVYLISRAYDAPALAEFGVAEVVAQSRHTRGESSPQDRWTLFRLRFHEDLARVPGNVHISPMQATGRAPGPFLPNPALARQR